MTPVVLANAGTHYHWRSSSSQMWLQPHPRLTSVVMGPCSLFVERPAPRARTYANQSVEDSREVALIAEAARQGHIR